ncbi:MAG: hypothetical protein FIO04_01495 [Nitrosopumilales archaeon]|nr:hypothetical protein [Nitrosopumilales archaeon]
MEAKYHREIEETYREINHPSGVSEVYEPKKRELVEKVQQGSQRDDKESCSINKRKITRNSL